MYLDGGDLSKVLLLARLFGFNPTTPEWRKYDEPARREGVSEECIGWWLAFPTIGHLSKEEASAMAIALWAACRWVLENPGRVPEWYQRPAWSTGNTLDEWARSPRAVQILRDVAALAETGPFAVKAWHWSPSRDGGCELIPIATGDATST